MCSWLWVVSSSSPLCPLDPPVAPSSSPQMMEGRQEVGLGLSCVFNRVWKQSVCGVGGRSVRRGIVEVTGCSSRGCPLLSAFVSLPFLLCETRLQEAVGFIRPFSISVWLKSLSAAETAETHTLVFIKYCASSCLNHSPCISNKTLH